MSTNFPSALDSYTNKTSSDLITSAGWNNLQDAIMAIQAKIGVDLSAVVTTLEYLLKDSSSEDPGHEHTLAHGANDVTSSAAELNILDGATITVDEINILDGVTASASEINILDGATITTAELNILDGVTASYNEINILDGLIKTTSELNALVSNATHTGDVTGSSALTIASAVVSQSKLKTSTGSVSTTSTSAVNLTLPGGEYGFYPRMWHDSGAIGMCVGSLGSVLYTAGTLTNISLYSSTGGGTGAHASQRYVTSSGEVFWLFVLRDKITKNPIAWFESPDHPCFGNGGKPLIVQHPFPDFDDNTQEIVCINPNPEEIAKMRLMCFVDADDIPDRSLMEVVQGEYVIVDNVDQNWSETPVTVGLPHGHDWSGMIGRQVDTIKKKIPKPDYIKVAGLKRRS